MEHASKSSLYSSGEGSSEDAYFPRSARSAFSTPSTVDTENTSTTTATRTNECASQEKDQRQEKRMKGSKGRAERSNALERSISDRPFRSLSSTKGRTQSPFDERSEGRRLYNGDIFTYNDEDDSGLEDSERLLSEDNVEFLDPCEQSKKYSPAVATAFDPHRIRRDTSTSMHLGGASVRSIGSGSKRRGRRQVTSTRYNHQALTLCQAKQTLVAPAPIGTVSGESDFSGRFGQENLSKISARTSCDFNRSEGSLTPPGSSLVALKRKGVRSGTEGRIASDNGDDLSQKMNASFSSFGRRSDKKKERNSKMGDGAFHESFGNYVESHPGPDMLTKLLSLDISQHSNNSRARFISRSNPSSDKVSIVMGTPSTIGGLSAFQVGNKEASIIEALLETTKETSPTKRKEAMRAWLEATAAELMSPTQHENILDSSRLSDRSSVMAEIPPPTLHESTKTSDTPLFRSTQLEKRSQQQSQDRYIPVSERYKGRSTKELLQILEMEKKQRSRKEMHSLGQSTLDPERTASTVEHEFLERAGIRSGRIDAQGREEDFKRIRSISDPRGARRKHRMSAQVGLHGNNSSGKQSEGSREKREVEVRKAKTCPGSSWSSRSVDFARQKSMKTRTAEKQAFTMKMCKDKRESSLDKAEIQKGESLDKSSLDKFLDHDVEANDSASHLIVSPGGTPKRQADAVSSYKATLKDDRVKNAFTRRNDMRKMKSVPNLGVKSEDFATSFMTKHKACKAKKKNKETPERAKVTQRNKKKKKNRIKKAYAGVDDLSGVPVQINSLSHGPSGVQRLFQKSKSMSNLMQRELNIEDKDLLVERLKSLSTPDTSDSKRKQPLPVSPLLRRTPKREKIKKAMHQVRPDMFLQKSQSMRCTVTSRPVTLLTEARWSSTSCGLTLTHDSKNTIDKTDDEVAPLTGSEKSCKKKLSEEENEEIIDVSAAPIKPRRRVSRESIVPEWKSQSRSTPNLRPAATTTKIRQKIKISQNGDIAEGSILEVSDDATACSELTDVQSVDFERSVTSRKKKSKKHLSSIHESRRSFGELTSDSLTKDAELHKRRRWDNPRSEAEGLGAMRSAQRHNQPSVKKFDWLKKKLPFVK